MSKNVISPYSNEISMLYINKVLCEEFNFSRRQNRNCAGEKYKRRERRVARLELKFFENFQEERKIDEPEKLLHFL